MLAIDLEWRPEVMAGQRTPVAVMQLASATACVILHTSAMGFQLPKAVFDLLADPSVIMLGFGWDSADETKMMSTFSIGKAKFHNFLDLQASWLDLPRSPSPAFGLAALRLCVFWGGGRGGCRHAWVHGCMGGAAPARDKRAVIAVEGKHACRQHLVGSPSLHPNLGLYRLWLTAWAITATAWRASPSRCSASRCRSPSK